MPFILRAFAAALLALLLPLSRAEESTNIGANAQPSPGGEAVEHEPVPPAPAGFVLDQAHTLLPAAAADMSARLTTAAAADVHIYVVTVKSLGVPASQQRDRVSKRAKEYAAGWLGDKVGAILLFDDEGGLMSIELSKGTDLRFTIFAVEAEMKAALSQISERELARDKIVLTSQIVTDALFKRQSVYVKGTHRQHIANLIMGGITLLGIGLAIYSALSKPKAEVDIAARPAPPADF